MSFTPVDWVFAIIIIAFALTSLAKGFIESIFNKLSWILGIIAAVLLYKSVSDSFLKSIQNQMVRNVCSFVLIFVIVFIIVKLIQMIMKRIFELNILNSLDRVLGFAFGIVEGCAVVALAIFLLNMQPFFNVSKLFEGSFFYNIVSSLFLSRKGAVSNV